MNLVCVPVAMTSPVPFSLNSQFKYANVLPAFTVFASISMISPILAAFR